MEATLTNTQLYLAIGLPMLLPSFLIVLAMLQNSRALDTFRSEAKGDIQRLDGNLASFGSEVKGDILRLDGNLASLRNELKGDLQRLEGKIDKLQGSLEAINHELGAHGKAIEILERVKA